MYVCTYVCMYVCICVHKMYKYCTVDLYREHHLEQSLLQFSTFRCVSADVGSRSPSCVGKHKPCGCEKAATFRCAPQVVTGAWTWISRCPRRHMAVTRHQMTVMRPWAKAGLDARDRAPPQMRHMKSMVRTMMMMGLTVKSSENG